MAQRLVIRYKLAEVMRMVRRLQISNYLIFTRAEPPQPQPRRALPSQRQASDKPDEPSFSLPNIYENSSVDSGIVLSPKRRHYFNELPKAKIKRETKSGGPKIGRRMQFDS